MNAMPPSSDPLAAPDMLYEAVARRDASMDGRFFYAVATTGVYCRPSCGARLARRENMSFYTTTQAAERAGFRACRRCRPTEPKRAERHAALMAGACRAIAHAAEDGEDLPDLAALAAAAGLSPFHFHRVFRAIVGVTPKAYAAAERAKRVRAHLEADDATVTAAIYDAGYGSSSRFYETAGAALGMKPTEYRDGGRNADIRFAVAECSLGTILVAATAKGVCAIQFGQADDLVRELQDRFPKATLLGADPAFEALVARVIEAVDAPRARLDLPLDVRGTAFQRRVWQALRDIPLGETASYAAIAARIGQPAAVRAVAGACAANPVAVAIPCHRVVRTDGALSGYRWGVERKRALLEREAAA
jgi:AraC family transcriptional regulator of adaptative response/methylated-DNA-[protein]-cysteine methyltransferase